MSLYKWKGSNKQITLHMKNIKLLLLVLMIYSCNAQQEETYWKADNVTRENNKPMWGITGAYMDMIANMRIHLSTNNDTLFFSYPYEKKIKMSELKSLTNCRIKANGALLDSIYEVKNEGDKLQIKFWYAGTGENNHFVLNLVNIDKEKYDEEVKKLKTDKAKLQAMIQPVDMSTVDLSISKPAYFASNIDLNILNPIATAESLADIKSIFGVIDKHSFEVDDKGKYEYNYYELLDSDKPLANIGQINFYNLAFATNVKTNNNDVIVLTQNDVDKNSIKALFSAINSKHTNNTINEIGLPNPHSLIGKEYGITWSDKNQIVKLIIKTPDELYYKDSNNGNELTDKPSTNEIVKVFNHCVDATQKTKVRIIIIAKAFDSLISSKNLSGMPPPVLEKF